MTSVLNIVLVIMTSDFGVFDRRLTSFSVLMVSLFCSCIVVGRFYPVVDTQYSAVDSSYLLVGSFFLVGFKFKGLYLFEHFWVQVRKSTG